MVKWEYRKFHVGRCGSVPPVSAVDRALDEIGEDGWELVCSVGEWLFFKRPAEPCKLEVDVLEEYDRAIEAVIDTRPCTCSACRERRETGYCPDADDEDAL